MAAEPATPRQYLLGAVWMFLVPMVGLIVGCALAGGWEGHPVRQAVAIAGGLAAGVLIGILGRRLTLHEPAVPPCGSERGKA